MQYFLAVIACFIFSLTAHANNTPRGIYRASEVRGSPLLLASGLAWSDAGLVIADRKEKRLVVLRPDGKFEPERLQCQKRRVAANLHVELGKPRLSGEKPGWFKTRRIQVAGLLRYTRFIARRGGGCVCNESA